MVASACSPLAASIYLIYVLEILKLRRGRLNPETGEFEAIELGAVTQLQRVVANLTNRLQKANPGPGSDIVASPPARLSRADFMSPPKYVDLLLAGRRAARSFCSADCPCSATPSLRRPGWPSAGSRRSPAAAPTDARPTATASGRWGSSPRPPSAASG